MWEGGCDCGDVGVVWGCRVYLFSCLLESMILPWVMGMVISRIHFTTRTFVICNVSILTYSGLRCRQMYCIMVGVY